MKREQIDQIKRDQQLKQEIQAMFKACRQKQRDILFAGIISSTLLDLHPSFEQAARLPPGITEDLREFLQKLFNADACAACAFIDHCDIYQKFQKRGE